MLVIPIAFIDRDNTLLCILSWVYVENYQSTWVQTYCCSMGSSPYTCILASSHWIVQDTHLCVFSSPSFFIMLSIQNCVIVWDLWVLEYVGTPILFHVLALWWGGVVNREIRKSTRKEFCGRCYKKHYEIATTGFTGAVNSANPSLFPSFLSWG